MISFKLWANAMQKEISAFCELVLSQTECHFIQQVHIPMNW